MAISFCVFGPVYSFIVFYQFLPESTNKILPTFKWIDYLSNEKKNFKIPEYVFEKNGPKVLFRLTEHGNDGFNKMLVNRSKIKLFKKSKKKMSQQSYCEATCKFSSCLKQYERISSDAKMKLQICETADARLKKKRAKKPKFSNGDISKMAGPIELKPFSLILECSKLWVQKFSSKILT